IVAMLAAKDVGNRWISAALLSSLSTGTAEVFSSLLSNNQLKFSREGREFLQQLLAIIGARNREDEVANSLERIKSEKNRPLAFSLTKGFIEGARRQGRAVADLAELQPIVKDAGEVAMDRKAEESLRLEAIELLGVSGNSRAAFAVF